MEKKRSEEANARLKSRLQKYAVGFTCDFEYLEDCDEFRFCSDDNKFIYITEGTDKESVARDFLYFQATNNDIPEFLEDQYNRLMKWFIEYGIEYEEIYQSFTNADKIVKLQDQLQDELIEGCARDRGLKIEYFNDNITWSLSSEATEKNVNEVFLKHPFSELVNLLNKKELAKLYYECFKYDVYVITLTDFNEFKASCDIRG